MGIESGKNARDDRDRGRHRDRDERERNLILTARN